MWHIINYICAMHIMQTVSYETNSLLDDRCKEREREFPSWETVESLLTGTISFARRGLLENVTTQSA